MVSVDGHTDSKFMSRCWQVVMRKANINYDLYLFQQLQMVIDQPPDIVAEASDSDDEGKVKQKYMKYDVEDSKLDSSGIFYKDSDSELEMESDSENEEDKVSLGKKLNY